MKKRYLDGNSYLRDIWSLASIVSRSSWRPDVIVALWRGGAPVGVAMHEFFAAAGRDTKHIPLKCASYTGIGVNDGGVEFFNPKPVLEVVAKAQKVLVVDDVFDTGKTAQAVLSLFKDVCSEVKFAAVYWKKEKNLSDLVPDYFVKETGGDWLVFPHEIVALGDDEIKEKDPFLYEKLTECRKYGE